MTDKSKLLPAQDSINYGSGDLSEDLFTPKYTAINASAPHDVTEPEDDATTPARAATPRYSDSLLSAVPKVTQEVEVKTKLYTRRWYILLVFSLFSATQNMVWNTWAPVSDSSEDAFNWTDGTISFLTNWGPISYLVGALFFSWLIGAKGLRVAVVLSAFLITVGCGIRCISSEPPLVTWINHICQALNGLAGPVAMFGPPVLSTIWFGPNERATSTAISVVVSAMGIAASFVLGPYLVPDRLNPNCTRTKMNSTYTPPDCITYVNQSGVRIQDERKNIMLMLYIEGGWSVLVLLLVLVYFPRKPPLPPSVSASHRREDFLTGIKTLFRRSQFWLITFVYAIAFGVVDCWSGVVDVIVGKYGLSEKQAGWMGFYGIFAQVATSLVIARFADIFSRHFKLFIFVCYAAAAVAFLLFSLICIDVLPFSIGFLYTCYISAIMFLYGSNALIFELAGELTYPVSEATTTSVLTLVNNCIGFIFLFIPQIPHIGTAWMNWTVVGCVGACLPGILLMRERYYRLGVDENEETRETEQY